MNETPTWFNPAPKSRIETALNPCRGLIHYTLSLLNPRHRNIFPVCASLVAADSTRQDCSVVRSVGVVNRREGVTNCEEKRYIHLRQLL